MSETRKKTGGRVAGTPNKDTKDIRAMFKKLVEDNLEDLQEDIDKLKGPDKIRYTLEMAKFCIPTLKSVDYKGDVVIEAKRRISFIDKSKEPEEDQEFIPPTNEPIF